MRRYFATISAAAPAFAALAVLSGCTFSREVVNPEVRDLDVTWIEPGVTTREEVLERLGPPSRAAAKGAGEAPAAITPNALRYICGDVFTKNLRVGYYVYSEFERSSGGHICDIAIENDGDGVVTRVSRIVTDGDKILEHYYKERK